MQKFLTGFIYSCIWLISLPPLKVLYGLSWVGYQVLYRITSYRKLTIEKNIRTSFPELSDEEVRYLIKKYYRHLSQVSVESLKAMHWSVEKMTGQIRLTNPEYLSGFSASGQNIIVLAGHTGNWEWLPGLVSPYGFDLLGVYKPQKNSLSNELSIRIRRKEGVIPIAMKETARAIKQVNGDSKPRALLLIADQTPPKQDIHFWHEFLNQPTAWFTGGEKIARKYNLPVVFMRVIKTGKGLYEGTAIPVSLMPEKEKEGEITRKYIQELEKNIKIQPENWLWSHRRWKHQPVDLSLQSWPK